jgi:hypothetical protein
LFLYPSRTIKILSYKSIAAISLTIDRGPWFQQALF